MFFGLTGVFAFSLQMHFYAWNPLRGSAACPSPGVMGDENVSGWRRKWAIRFGQPWLLARLL